MNRTICIVAAVALGVVLASGGPVWAGPYYDAVMDDNPVGYWRLGEAVGSTTAADETSPQYNGTYLNDALPGRPGAIFGDPDTAAYFDGSGDKVDIPQSAALNSASFSFECWAKVQPGSGGGHRSPMTSRNDGPQQGYIFYARGGSWQYWTGPGWHNLGGPGGSVVEDQWTHLVGTYDAGTGEKNLYINGALANTATGVTVNPNLAHPLRIGGGATEGAGNYWFRGDVDEAAVYNTVLSADRIETHYYLGAFGQPPLQPFKIFRAEFDNPGGVGLGPDASQMSLWGHTANSPGPTNPDGELVLGGNGSGSFLFTGPLKFEIDKAPLIISTQAYYTQGDAPPSQANAYMGLVALHLEGTSTAGAERRGGLWAQFQPYTDGTGHMRVGFQSATTAPEPAGDLWFDSAASLGVSGIPDANGIFDMELFIGGLEDTDPIVFTVSQDPFEAQIATTIGGYRNSLPAGDIQNAFDLVLSELRADPTQMNFGFISTATRVDGYLFLQVDGYLVPEPATVALFALGGLCVVACGWRRRKARRINRDAGSGVCRARLAR